MVSVTVEYSLHLLEMSKYNLSVCLVFSIYGHSIERRLNVRLWARSS